MLRVKSCMSTSSPEGILAVCAKSLHRQRNYRLGGRERGLRTEIDVHPLGGGISSMDIRGWGGGENRSSRWIAPHAPREIAFLDPTHPVGPPHAYMVTSPRAPALSGEILPGRPC